MKLPPWLWRVFASRRLKIALICSPFVLMIGLVAFYGIVNWWGLKQFDKSLLEFKAEGLALSVEEALGNFPDDEDALNHPALIAEMNRPPADRLQGLNGFSVSGFSRDQTAWECIPVLGLRPDITRWADPPRPGQSEAEVATHLLSMIATHSARFDSMKEAFRRPHARWIRAGDVNASSRLSAFSRLPNFVADRAILKLACGDREGAASDVLALVDLLVVLEKNPQTMGWLMAMAGELKLSEVIWNGIDRGMWTEVDLRNFQSALEHLDLQKAAAASVDLMLTIMIAGARESPAYLGQLKESSDWDDLGNSFVTQALQGDGAAVWNILKASWLKARPSGYNYLALIDHIRFVRSEREKTGQPHRPYFSPRNRRHFIESAYQASGFQENAYFILEMFTKQVIRAETRSNLLRCGIALERYRLKHGALPDKLEAVVPEFLSAVPPDVCDRLPLRYRRLPDGSPHVWSLWPSEKDENGIPRQSADRGNYAWTTGTIPGFTERVYKW